MPQLYVDLMSQPSRACVILCKLWQLPVEVRLVRVDKGEQRGKEYRATVNPLGKVPCLVDQELRLPESAAIMQYLCTKYTLLASWCPPTDAAHLVARARFDAAMHWQHSTIRAGSMRLVWHAVIGKRLGAPVSAEVAEHGRQVLEQGLADLQAYWLDGGRRPFMTGDAPCIADLQCACELEQLRMLALAPAAPQFDDLLAPHPAVVAWMERVRAATNPAYDEAHRSIRASVQRGRQQQAARPKL